MAVRLPFFGMLSLRSPLHGFLEHYEQIAVGMALIEESLECYVSGGSKVCKEFSALQKEVDKAEEKADVIKRSIRNHLPRSIFLPVEKHIFFSYTRQQDDILDAGQSSLQWLAMRDVIVPEEFQHELLVFIDEVSKSVKLLKPCIEGTIAWVNDEGIDREELKSLYRTLRDHHHAVTKAMHRLNSRLYSSDLDFKDIYQLIHFVEHLHKMSHSAEGCVDLLRIMIAR